MKKLVSVFVLFIGLVVLQSCTGPEGPRGPQGYPGPASEVFEVTTSFTFGNGYESIFNLNPPIYSSDVVLVYELSGIHQGQDIWKLLPQTYYFDQEIMSYNYDFTTTDFRLFMDATFDVGFLDPSWREGITFRIVIIPGYFSVLDVDVSDINAVMSHLNLNDASFIQL